MAADVDLRLSAQRALNGNVPLTLRAASVSKEGNKIRLRAIFDRGASPEDKECLSVAGTEIIADFEDDVTIEEEFVDLPAPIPMTHLEHLVFMRAEDAT